MEPGQVSDRGPAVSVVIPHLDDLDGLRRALAALEDQTLPRERRETLVVDNGSRVGLAAVRSAVAGRARVLVEREAGAAAARNAGIAAARGAILAFLDSDCVPDPDWLERGVRAVGSSAGVVGGRVDVARPEGRPLDPAEAFELVFAFRNAMYVRRKGFSVTANLFVRADLFGVVGGFRGGVSEDSDWCFRAAAAGFPVSYADEARVTHPPRRDWAALVRKWDRLVRESHALVGDGVAARVAWLVRHWAVALSPLWHAATVVRSDRLAAGEKFGAIVTLCRIRFHRVVAAHRVAFAARPETERGVEPTAVADGAGRFRDAA